MYLKPFSVPPLINSGRVPFRWGGGAAIQRGHLNKLLINHARKALSYLKKGQLNLMFQLGQLIIRNPQSIIQCPSPKLIVLLLITKKKRKYEVDSNRTKIHRRTQTPENK
jgi:hypothetical protein